MPRMHNTGQRLLEPRSPSVAGACESLTHSQQVVAAEAIPLASIWVIVTVGVCTAVEMGSGVKNWEYGVRRWVCDSSFEGLGEECEGGWR
jgi:hypothetical protein